MRASGSKEIGGEGRYPAYCNPDKGEPDEDEDGK
jgi:hypothetical protein